MYVKHGRSRKAKVKIVSMLPHDEVGVPIFLLFSFPFKLEIIVG
jgi:hypothetical protein